MPSYKDFYGSKTLSATSLGSRKLRGKILAVGPETMEGKNGKESTKLCLTVAGEEKLVPLNSTNAQRVGAKFGDNYEKWKGRTVQVTTQKVTMGDKEVDGLLVSPA